MIGVLSQRLPRSTLLRLCLLNQSLEIGQGPLRGRAAHGLDWDWRLRSSIAYPEGKEERHKT